ncbi:MAG: hydroxymethylbilane synthase [Armatimonadota bacterium]
MNERTLRIATRRSKLALAQSHWIQAQLEARHPGLRVELREYVTRGDQIQDVPLHQVGGKGLFTKEVEDALLSGEADLAVHSLKDLPSEQPEGLILAAVPEREDPRDALVLPAGAAVPEAVSIDPLVPSPALAALPSGARVGSSSLRRSSQLLHARPDLRVESVRGNVDTRLRKLDEGQYDVLILAAAGLRRLGLESRISAPLPVELSTPAPGQGALGIECRADDPVTRELLAVLDHAPTRHAVLAERALMEAFGGGCSIPLGGYARIDGEVMHVLGVVASADGSCVFREATSGRVEEAAELGRTVARQLIEAGAGEIIRPAGDAGAGSPD